MIIATSTTALLASTSTVATKIHHTRKKIKNTTQPLPSSSKSQNNHHHNHKTQVGEKEEDNHKTQIGEKKKGNHKTQIGEKKEERQRGKNPHKSTIANQTTKQNTHTHTHTHKPTISNLYKSKPITSIYCTMTHYNPDPLQPRPTTHHPTATRFDLHPSTNRLVKTWTSRSMNHDPQEPTPWPSDRRTHNPCPSEHNC